MTRLPKSSNRRRRRFDPERRLRIAQAAVEVVGKWGVEGLTHRRVAELADIPLGSITYHFATLEDLLAVAIEVAAQRNKEIWIQWSEGLSPASDLAQELADELVRILGGRERTRQIVQLELYLTAVRRPNLRSASVAWGQVLHHVLARHADAATARALTFMVEGIGIASLVSAKPPRRNECLEMFRRVMQAGKDKSGRGAVI